MEINVYNVIQALGWSMFHSLGLGACCYAVLYLLWLVCPRHSAAVKHNMALGMQFIVFAGFVTSFVYYYTHSGLAAVPSSTMPAEIFRLAVTERGKDFSLENLFPYVAGCYFVGLTVQLLLLASSYARLLTLRYSGLDPIPLPWIDVFEASRRRLGIRKEVSVYLSRHVTVPLTIGFVKPFVLFPMAYVNKLSMDQVESILLHELAHVKRQDFLCNLFKVAIETVLFFNPFIWALSRIIAREREHACDDDVMRQLGTPIPYARALVALEELRMNKAPVLSMAATGTKNQLLERIKRMTNMESKPRNMKQQFAALVVGSLVLFTLVVLFPAQPSNAGVRPAPQVDTIVPPADTTVPPALPIADTVKIPKEVRVLVKKMEKDTRKLRKQIDSPEWKRRVADIQDRTAKLTDYLHSDKWKSRMDSLQKMVDDQKWGERSMNGLHEYFESKEWKDHLQAIEEKSRDVASYFESPE